MHNYTRSCIIYIRIIYMHAFHMQIVYMYMYVHSSGRTEVSSLCIPAIVVMIPRLPQHPLLVYSAYFTNDPNTLEEMWREIGREIGGEVGGREERGGKKDE